MSNSMEKSMRMDQSVRMDQSMRVGSFGTKNLKSFRGLGASLKKDEVQEKVILVAFSLPKLSAYVDRDDVAVVSSNPTERKKGHPQQQKDSRRGSTERGASFVQVTKTVTTMLQKLENAAEDAAEFYCGDVISNCLSMVICRFPTVVDALDAAFLVEEVLSRFADDTRRHHAELAEYEAANGVAHSAAGDALDLDLVEFGAWMPASFVTAARPIGFKGSTAEAHRLRACSEELRMHEAMLKMAEAAQHASEPPRQKVDTTPSIGDDPMEWYGDTPATKTDPKSSLWMPPTSVVRQQPGDNSGNGSHDNDGFHLPGILCQAHMLKSLIKSFETRSSSIIVGKAATIQVIQRLVPRGAGDDHHAQGGGGLTQAELALRKLPRDVRKAWEKFDLNKDAELQRHEVHDVLELLEYDLSEWEIDDFFDELDVDHSGAISVKEFADQFQGPLLGIAALTRDIKNSAKKIAVQTGLDSLPLIMEMWKQYDTSGDGSLDAGEFHCLLLDLGVDNVTNKEIEWLMKKFDEDDSGCVEFDEFASAISSKTLRGGFNPTKQKIVAAKRASTPKLFSTTPAQAQDDKKRDRQKWFDKYVIYFLFIWMMYNSGRSTFRTFARHVETENTELAIFDWCLDLFYFAWVIAKLFWLPWDDQGLCVVDTKEIIRRYCTSPDFWVDVIVLLPLDIAYWTDPTAITIGFYRLNKCFSLYYLSWAFAAITANISPTYAAVVRSVMWFLMAAHVWACFFVGVGHTVGSEATTDIFEVEGVVDTDTDPNARRLLYLRSLYWAILCLAGQLQGDGIPILDVHVALSLGVAMSGVPLYAMLLATFSSVNDIESAENLYTLRLDRVLSYSSYFELGTEFRDGALEYYRHVFNTTGSLNLEYELPHDLPEELQILMNIEIGTQFLVKVPVFAKVLESPSAGALINELVSCMRSVIVEPNTVVLKRGEDSQGMFFVQDGEFVGFGADDPHEERPLFSCKSGTFFGEIGLLLGTKSTATLKSAPLGYSNLLAVRKADFQDVMSFFPDALNTLCEAATERWNQVTEADRAKEAARLEKERRILEEDVKGGLVTEEESLKRRASLDESQKKLNFGSAARRAVNLHFSKRQTSSSTSFEATNSSESLSLTQTTSGSSEPEPNSPGGRNNFQSRRTRPRDGTTVSFKPSPPLLSLNGSTGSHPGIGGASTKSSSSISPGNNSMSPRGWTSGGSEVGLGTPGEQARPGSQQAAPLLMGGDAFQLNPLQSHDGRPLGEAFPAAAATEEETTFVESMNFERRSSSDDDA